MSLDSSLKSGGGLVRHRNVLTRGERLAKLTEAGKWDTDKQGVFGLPKVGNRKLIVGGKSEKKEEAADGAAPAAKGAAPAAKAPAGKAAAGKAAAPAAKAAAKK